MKSHLKDRLEEDNVKLYWVSLLIQDTENSKLWVSAMSSGCTNLGEAMETIEEYYFAACLAYAEENGFSQFFNEEDDLKIFDYCGTEL